VVVEKRHFAEGDFVFPETDIFSNTDYFLFVMVKTNPENIKVDVGCFCVGVVSSNLTLPTIPIKYPDYLAMVCGGEVR
jgi:hypothetical protein